MAEVRFEHVDKTYGSGGKQVSVIRDLNLAIRDHEFLVLVGPSGCGKTTALRMVAGLEEITSGEVHIGDKVVNDLPPVERDIAMVFQNYALYPHMTVAENIGFPLKQQGVKKDEAKQRVQDAARFTRVAISSFLTCRNFREKAMFS